MQHPVLFAGRIEVVAAAGQRRADHRFAELHVRPDQVVNDAGPFKQLRQCRLLVLNLFDAIVRVAKFGQRLQLRFQPLAIAAGGDEGDLPARQDPGHLLPGVTAGAIEDDFFFGHER